MNCSNTYYAVRLNLIMQVPEINFERRTHRGLDSVFLRLGSAQKLHDLARSLPRRKWSSTHGAWYVPYEPGIEQQLKARFAEHGTASAVNSNHAQSVPKLSAVPAQPKPSTGVNPLSPLSGQSMHHLQALKSWMQSRRYSESTVDVYCEAMTVFLRYHAFKASESISNDDLVAFNNNYILKNRLSASYQNQFVNAVKLFCWVIADTKLQPELVHRPKRAKVLPNVLSKEEVKLILQSLINLKHRTILSLVYSCGLRRNEVLNLCRRDVDEHRGLVVIRQGKGKKDRIVPLSGRMKDLLHEYYAAYNPKHLVFEGQSGVGKYDESSLANVLRNAVEKSGIKKPVTLHWLRHSYATHLLEAGTDLRYIQTILGHSRSTTTEIYTHISNLSIQRVVSPFESL
jgi:integrase/recombinase XerD